MPAYTATAPGKIILLGEHAVVYGQPALAVPVRDVRARAVVQAEIKGEEGSIQIIAPEIGLRSRYSDLPADHPLRVAINGVHRELGISRTPACSLRIHSTIPIASGLGSSAAVSAAVIQAVAGFLGHPLPKERVSSLVLEVEKIHHGTPSGIDNTVVTYNKPVFFTKEKPIQTLSIGKPFTFVIGDTGVLSATAETVGFVRKAYQEEKRRFEALFSTIGSLVIKARSAIVEGRRTDLGVLMDENHTLLKEMGVSSPELNRLVEGAQGAGALGAKLSGGGRGGNMIALVVCEQAEQMAQSLRDIGATNTIITQIAPS
jgi:mevalonate kinase